MKKVGASPPLSKRGMLAERMAESKRLGKAL
jgi:hypothetical protein